MNEMEGAWWMHTCGLVPGLSCCFFNLFFFLTFILPSIEHCPRVGEWGMSKSLLALAYVDRVLVVRYLKEIATHRYTQTTSDFTSKFLNLKDK